MGGVLYNLSTLQCYVKGALRKKQLIAFLVLHFNEKTSIFSFMILKVSRVVS